MMPAVLLSAALLHPKVHLDPSRPVTAVTFERAAYVSKQRRAYIARRRRERRRQVSKQVAYISNPVPAVWQALAECESGGNWQDTAGGYEGGVQFLNSTWLADGGGKYAQHAYDASPLEQLTVARVALASGGVGQWPVCGPQVGLAPGD